MDKEKAVNKLLDYLNSIEVDGLKMQMFYGTKADRHMIVLNIKTQIRKYKLENPKGAEYKSFEIGEGEPGVFISYQDYVGYYCYDFAFFFNIPAHTQITPFVTIWTPDNEYGVKKRIYEWTNTKNTYDITSLVMKTSQMPYMNWNENPFEQK